MALLGYQGGFQVFGRQLRARVYGRTLLEVRVPHLAPDETLWPITPHTKCKHEILRRYLNGWYPKLTVDPKRTVLYIDGFAGPGRYAGGEPGSPIIALETIAAHKVKRRNKIRFLFVESDEQRFRHLQKEVDTVRPWLPSNFIVELKHGLFDETLSGILDILTEQARALSPAFAFIDPFGFTGAPISLIKRIMANPKCEVMINFAYDSISRFGLEDQNRKYVTALFGTSEWEEVKRCWSPDSRRRFLLQLYIKQLKQVAQVSYVLTFEMRDRSNQTEYYLVYGTNSVDGIRVMKYAMWSQDPSGQYQFSDFSHYTAVPNQPTLLQSPDPLHIGNLLARKFAGQKVSSMEIRNFLLVSTPFRETHADEALNALKKYDPGSFHILNPERIKKQGTYPCGTIIQFR